MSNPLRKLWNSLRSSLGGQTSFTVNVHETGQTLTNEAKKTVRRKASKRKVRSYKFMDKGLAKMSAVGTYSMAPRGDMSLATMQTLMCNRLREKFGSGNFMTHMNRVTNRLEVAILRTE